MDQLSDKVMKYLTTFTREIEEGMKEDRKAIAQEGAKRLKTNSPQMTGKYKAGWGVTEKNTQFTIHNKKRASLTHLLEKGHAKRGGGRVKGIEHIKPVEDWVIQEFEKQTLRRIKG